MVPPPDREGLSPYPETGRRQALEQEAEVQGMEHMLSRLKAVDPDSAARLHLADRKRIIRALTYEPRQLLYDRIDLRVDNMLEQGLLEEIRSLLDRGIPRQCTAMQAIGYKEFLPVLDGSEQLETAVEQHRRQQLRLSPFAAIPHRSHRMDHIPARQTVGPCDLCLTGFALSGKV